MLAHNGAKKRWHAALGRHRASAFLRPLCASFKTPSFAFSRLPLQIRCPSSSSTQDIPELEIRSVRSSRSGARLCPSSAPGPLRMLRSSSSAPFAQTLQSYSTHMYHIACTTWSLACSRYHVVYSIWHIAHSTWHLASRM